MATTISLPLGVPVALLTAATAVTPGVAYALPARAAILAWQTSYNVNPSAITVLLQVSIDGVVWTTLDTSTAVAGETRTITTPTAALFVRANPTANVDPKQVTVTIVAKAGQS